MVCLILAFWFIFGVVLFVVIDGPMTRVAKNDVKNAGNKRRQNETIYDKH